MNKKEKKEWRGPRHRCAWKGDLHRLVVEVVILEEDVTESIAPSLHSHSATLSPDWPTSCDPKGRQAGFQVPVPKVTPSGEAATALQHVCYLHSCDVRTHQSVQRRTTGTRHTAVQYNKYKHYENEEIFLIYIIFLYKMFKGCFNNQEFIFDPPLKDFHVWSLHWICIINVWLFF